MLGMVKDINGTKQIQTLGGFTVYADLPIGSVISYMGTVDKIPLGFLYCDNTVRHKADYPELWAVLPDTVKDLENETFTLDFRGEFLRGAGTNGHANQGNGGTVGEHQDATIVDVLTRQNNELQRSNDGNVTEHHYDSFETIQGYNLITGGQYTSDPSNGHYTTRPTNISVNHIIKAKQVGVPQDLLSNINALVEQLTTAFNSPDWSHMNSVFTSGTQSWYDIYPNGYTCPDDGWLVGWLGYNLTSAPPNDPAITINGVILTRIYESPNYINSRSVYTKVNKGDVINSAEGSLINRGELSFVYHK